MMYTMMHGKIHRATVTEANLEYMGSITIDQDLMDAAGILPGEGCRSAITTTAPVWKPTPFPANGEAASSV